MRLLLVMLAITSTVVACQKSAAPAGEHGTATTAPTPGATGPSKDEAAASKAAAAADEEASPQADEGNGEPMDDVDEDEAPPTDKSGADPAAEEEEAGDIELQE